MAHRCRRVGAVHHIIRVAPTSSKASPNVRYAFNGDRICASQRNDEMGPIGDMAKYFASPRSMANAPGVLWVAAIRY
jgi:hypothetical protein